LAFDSHSQCFFLVRHTLAQPNQPIRTLYRPYLRMGSPLLLVYIHTLTHVFV
jgi:hypothetical protein